MLLNHEISDLYFIRWLTAAQPTQIRRHDSRPDPAAEARAACPEERSEYRVHAVLLIGEKFIIAYRTVATDQQL